MGKSKKGIEGGGLSVIIAIVILIISAWAIIQVIHSTSKKADEKVQIDLCRGSNEVKVGSEHWTFDGISTPRFCNTIDKTSGKSLVPTKTYSQDIEGAKTEVRDMLKNCWYMWLDGSEPNIFRLFPEKQSCRICYKFKIKDGIKDTGVEGIKLASLLEKMNDPYYASISTSNCYPPNGGEWKTACDAGEQNIKPREGKNEFCCLKDLLHECENKGGQCSETPNPPFDNEYSKWACPSGQKCYVKGENMITYLLYVMEGSKNAGELLIDDDAIDVNTPPIGDTAFTKDRKYAISFISPSKQCTNSGCNAVWFVERSIAGSFLDGIELIGSHSPGPLKRIFRNFVEVANPLQKYPPNKLLISTYDKAVQRGCKED